MRYELTYIKEKLYAVAYRCDKYDEPRANELLSLIRQNWEIPDGTPLLVSELIGKKPQIITLTFAGFPSHHFLKLFESCKHIERLMDMKNATYEFAYKYDFAARKVSGKLYCYSEKPALKFNGRDNTDLPFLGQAVKTESGIVTNYYIKSKTRVLGIDFFHSEMKNKKEYFYVEQLPKQVLQQPKEMLDLS